MEMQNSAHKYIETYKKNTNEQQNEKKNTFLNENTFN